MNLWHTKLISSNIDLVSIYTGCTTHRMSYLPSDCKSLRPPQSYAPIRVYKPSDIPMNAETVMHLSYQPVEASQVERISDKTVYHPPDLPIDAHTTYNTRFQSIFISLFQ